MRNKLYYIYNSLILFFLTFLITIPSVKADIHIMNLYDDFSFYHLFFLIPVILIEVTILCLINYFFKFKFKNSHCIIMIIIANILTTAVGVFYPLIDYYLDNASSSLFLMYFFTSLIETPIIFLFIRKKIEKPLIISAYLSFFVNIYSYIFLFMITQ